MDANNVIDEVAKLKLQLEKSNIELKHRITFLEVQLGRLELENAQLKDCMGVLTTGFQNVMRLFKTGNTFSNDDQINEMTDETISSDDSLSNTSRGITEKNHAHEQEIVMNDEVEGTLELYKFPANCSSCRKVIPVNRAIIITECNHIFCGNCISENWNGWMIVCPFINKYFKCYTRCRYSSDNFENLMDVSSKWKCVHCSFVNRNHQSVICQMCCKTNVNTNRSIDVRSSNICQCILCKDTFPRVGDGGMVMSECGHQFCVNCVLRSFNNADANAVAICPFPSCLAQFSFNELTTFTKFHTRRLSFVNRRKRLFHCHANDMECGGSWTPTYMTTSVMCPACTTINCIPCQDIHIDCTCKEFQDVLFRRTDATAVELKRQLQLMLKNGLATQCPQCRIILRRQPGSNAISCLKCELDYVWDDNSPLTPAWRCLICYTINVDSSHLCDTCKRRRPIHSGFVEKSYIQLKCVVCNTVKYFYDGYIFENCSHFHCIDCLVSTITTSDTQIKCNGGNKCPSILKDYEIRELVEKECYDSYSRRLQVAMVNSIENAFACNKDGCTGWWIIDECDDLKIFPCPVCNAPNCVECKAIHQGISCVDFKKYGPAVKDRIQQYGELLKLDDAAAIENVDAFECPICITEFGPGKGIVLRECLHIFCKECLASVVVNNDMVELKCPFNSNDYVCQELVQEREIKAVVDEETYKKYLEISLRTAKQNMADGFQCKTVDCEGWWVYEDDVNEMDCPICGAINCMQCQAIHLGQNCQQYQDKIFNENDPNAIATKHFLESMVQRGEAMHCPNCKIIVGKRSGCDWMQCSMCRTEICWVTRGPRWGPAGNGDTTGGCRCRIGGRSCHPNCGNCH